MKCNEQIINQLADIVDEGIIYIDKNHILQLFNRKAKEILGVIIDKSKSHLGGKVEVGDIVIIADNCIGADDGGLDPVDLSLINITDDDIHKGDIIIGVGVYKNSEVIPIYKHWKPSHISKELSLNTDFLGFKINSYIDSSKKIISIVVNNEEHLMNYVNEIGHILIIDGKTGNVKFFQQKGYTVRKETILSILNGFEYLPKGDYNESIEVIGRKVDDIIEYSDLTDKINHILDGSPHFVTNDFYEINKRPTLCSIIPVKSDEQIEGVILKIRDTSELEVLLKDRNKIIEDIEKIKTNSSFRPNMFPEGSFSNFVGNSPMINEVKYLAFRASKFKSNVIITGESGTGKSQLAKEIHNLHVKDAPFVDVNCSSIPHNLFESELFGYVGGAFTGALSGGKEGYFEIANGGTIFLDEIGEIPLEMQVKLLQVLQNKKFYRVGSSKPITADVRVIAATNKNLKEQIEKGIFRQDLYYRLNVFPIEIPPLRERKSDIYLLINSILNSLCNAYNMHPKQLSGKALSKLISYSWSGNVRELENVLERAVTLCEFDMIYPEYINICEDEQIPFITLKDAVALTEKKLIEKAAKDFNRDKKLIMESLCISKSAFYEKLKKYKIEI